MEKKISKIEPPGQGWLQFLASRKEMLDAYDRARTYSRIHKVETYHGNLAEAEFRKWLQNFLPKKYAVTSGYIISAFPSDLEKVPHFDVIIYEHLEAPILWIEDSPDKSKQGRSLAIPSEYVKGVIEVKSAFKNSVVKSGINHLKELKNLLSSIDTPDERYKKYLPADFFCELVFFELRSENEFDKLALNSIVEGIELRGFGGGLILRGEGHLNDVTGRINLTSAKECTISNIIKPNVSLKTVFTEADSIAIKDDLHISAMLTWSEANFSQYAFDIVAKLNGKYKVGKLSSFHAYGDTDWDKAHKSNKIKNSEH